MGLGIFKNKAKLKIAAPALGMSLFLNAGILNAQNQEDEPDISVLEGKCSSDTSVIIDNEIIGFSCTNAVISSHPQRGSVLIQFAGKSDDGRDQILGLAGPMNSRDLITIERIYLTPDTEPLAPSNKLSACALMRTGDALTTIRCRAIAAAEGSTIEIRVRFIPSG